MLPYHRFPLSGPSETALIALHSATKELFAQPNDETLNRQFYLAAARAIETLSPGHHSLTKLRNLGHGMYEHILY